MRYQETANPTYIRTHDGKLLAATYYQADARNQTRLSVVINSATGVPRRYYDAFAQHLSKRGISCLTYDYRGTGDSRPMTGTIEDWGRYDQSAAIDFMGMRHPDNALAIVGHSLGGQVLGLAHNIERVKAAVFLCSQSGYWRHWSGVRRLRMWLLWWVLIPGLCPLFGRFPGRWFGTADLPAGVALNWARWGRSPHYICDESGNSLRPYNAKVTIPIRWVSFTDDSYAPRAAVEALRSYYPNATHEHLHLAPKDLGLLAVGHFGYFRKSTPSSRWDETASWLLARTEKIDSCAAIN